MHKLGDILAFLFNKLFIVLLVLMFVVFVPVIGVISTLTSAEDVQSVLDEADVYTTIPTNIIDIVEIEQQSDSGSPAAQRTDIEPSRTLRAELEANGVIDPDALVATILRTLDRDFLRETTEGVIDGVYVYLDGSASELEFELSLRERKDVVAEELQSLLSSSLSQAPECAPTETGDELDVLELDCRPPGGELEREINQFINELTDEDGVLGETYTQEDFDISEANLAFVKVGFGALESVAVLFWLAAVGLSFAVVLTAHSTHRGFKEVGVIYGLLGLLFLVLFGIFSSSVSISDMALQNSEEFSEQQLAAIQNITDPVAEAFQANVAGQIIFISIVMVFIGVGSYILGIVLTKHHVEHIGLHQHDMPGREEATTNKPSEDTASAVAPTKKSSKPKNKSS